MSGSNTVQSDDLGPGAQVKAADVAADAVNGGKVIDGSLAGLDIQNNSLAGADINESTLGEVPSAQLGGLGRFGAAGSCNPTNGSLVDCKITTINLQTREGAADRTCQRLRWADRGLGILRARHEHRKPPGSASYFETAANHSEQGALAGITGVLGAGSHDFAIDCNEAGGETSFQYVGITAVAISPD